MSERLDKTSRPSKDETFMQMAVIQSKRSVCLYHEAGVIIVNNRGQLISSGYNGPSVGDYHCMDVGCAKVDGEPMSKQKKRCRGAHAEINAIVNCSRDQLPGSTVYTTICPCYDCMKELNNAGVVRVVFKDHYRRVVNEQVLEDEPETFELCAKRGISIEQYKKGDD